MIAPHHDAPHHDALVIEVLGKPAPKGSARAFINKRTGRAFVAPGGAKSTEAKIADWNSAVRAAAADVVGVVDAPPFVDVPLVVAIEFRMARLGGHWGTGRNAGQLKPGAPPVPRGKPDIDKLARTTLDALTGTVFDDDSRIVSLAIAKVYAAPGREGARITVGEWTPRIATGSTDLPAELLPDALAVHQQRRPRIG